MAMSPEAKAAEEQAAHEKKMAEEKRIAELVEARVKEMRREYCRQQGRSVDDQLIPEKEDDFKDLARRQIAEEEAQAKAGPAAPLSKSQEVLKEQISKFSSVFQGGRFEFIGTALQALGDFLVKLMPVFQSIMPQLKNIAPMLNRAAGGSKEPSDATPMDDINDLLEKGRLTAANEILKEEELQLLNDMDKALDADKDAKVSQEHVETLNACRQELKTLEDHLEALTPLKKDETKKDDLKAHLEQIEQDLKKIKEHYETLEPLVAAAGDSLKSLPVIFERMKPIIEAHQKLCEREEAALPKAAAPPA